MPPARLRPDTANDLVSERLLAVTVPNDDKAVVETVIVGVAGGVPVPVMDRTTELAPALECMIVPENIPAMVGTNLT